jgi:hypothetical protein
VRPPLSIHLGTSGRILVPDDAATTDECGDYVGSTGAPAARHERTALETQSFRFTIVFRDDTRHRAQVAGNPRSPLVAGNVNVRCIP